MMKLLTVMLLSSLFVGANFEAVAGDPYDTNVPEIEQFESQANIERAYNTLKEKFNIDTSFKFKQDALNTLVCDGNWGTALCHLYQKDKYFAFQLDNLEEISTFPLELVKDEKEETVFKNLTFENEDVYLKITDNPFEKNCGLKLARAQTINQKEWVGYASFQKVDENCPLKVKKQEVYKRKDVQKIEKNLKMNVITDRTFQFKQQALNYVLCDTHHMETPLCELHLKGADIGFSLKNPEKFYVSLPEIVEDKPHQTILKYFDVQGNPSFVKIKIAENNPCFLTIIRADGKDKSCVAKGAERQSVNHYQSLAPFCDNYPLLK